MSAPPSKPLPPAVVVHGLAHARVALAEGMPVALLSAPGAALYLGCAFWRALVARATAECPDVPAYDILDCADAAGQALAALRIGQRLLVLSLDAPGRDAVAAIASRMGALLLPARPPALDLAKRGAVRHLPAWLRDARADDSGPAAR